MKRCWDAQEYRICPHTATAVHYDYKHTTTTSASNGGRRACLATASPIKFPDALAQAGVPLPDMKILNELRAQRQQVVRLTDKAHWIPSVRAAIEKITEKTILRVIA